jgi:hypothetical protein
MKDCSPQQKLAKPRVDFHEIIGIIQTIVVYQCFRDVFHQNHRND